MFERLSDRSRRVVDLAREKARRCGEQNVDVEHMLFGLVQEGGGVGAHALKRLGANLRGLCAEIEKHLGRQEGVVVEGKPSLTPRAKALIERAVNEARLMGCNYVGTEHLLLSLASETSPVVLATLSDLGVDRLQILAEVLSLLGRDAESTACEAEAGAAEEAAPFADDPGMKLAESLLGELVKRKEQAAANRDYEQAGAYRELAVQVFDLKKKLRAILDLWGRAQDD